MKKNFPKVMPLLLLTLSQVHKMILISIKFKKFKKEANIQAKVLMLMGQLKRIIVPVSIPPIILITIELEVIKLKSKP